MAKSNEELLQLKKEIEALAREIQALDEDEKKEVLEDTILGDFAPEDIEKIAAGKM